MYFVYCLDTADYCQGFPGDKCKVKPSTISFYKAEKQKKKAKVRANSWHCIKNKYTILSAVKNIITQFFRDFFEVEQKDDNLRAFL